MGQVQPKVVESTLWVQRVLACDYAEDKDDMRLRIKGEIG